MAITKVGNLRDRLDTIDSRVMKRAYDGFYKSRLAILVGEWEKGEAIASHFRGGKMRSWNQISKETGRRDVSLKKWHDLYEEYPNKEDYLEITEKKAKEWTQKALSEKDTKGVIAMLHTGDQESYTPEQYIESAREVMGSIDVDPASNEFANETVKAKTYYTVEDDGLTKEWNGNVFLNPPYEFPLIKNFVDKLLEEYRAGRTKRAILLTNNNTDTQWFHDAGRVSGIICFTRGRINFYKKDGSVSQPTNGQAFFYFGDEPEKFKASFRQYGWVGTVIKGVKGLIMKNA